jgi:PAS domain S-box-containing protein
MSQGKRTNKQMSGPAQKGINFWEVLNTAAAALQRAAHSETAVYDTFREQMTALGLQGSINWFDDTYTVLTMTSVVFPPRILRMLRRFEKIAGQTATGFQYPATLLGPYTTTLLNESVVFLPDNTALLQTLMVEKARPFVKQLVTVFGRTPGILAPLYIEGQVKGFLYLADQRLTAESCSAVIALANHLAIALENARLFQEIGRSREKMHLLTENIPGVIYQCVNNYTFDMLYLNDAVETLTGYPKERFLNGEISFRDLYHPDDSLVIQPDAVERSRPGLYHLVYRIRHRSGAWRWVEEFGKGVFDEQGKMLFLEGSISDITERKQAEMLQSTLYRIATVANADFSLEQIYPAIHTILSDLMDVQNFYIALVIEETGLIHLPYFVDEEDSYDGRPFDGSGGLTAYVIESGQPQLLSRMELKRLMQLDLLQVLGAMPEVWLGVPLRTQAKVFGAIVVQSYRDGLAYTEREKQLLFFVSGQVAAAIERKWSEDKLRAMAAEIVQQARMFEVVLSTMPDQFVVYDRDGRITFASSSMLQAHHLSAADVSGKTMDDLAFLPPDIMARIEQDGEEIFRTGKPIHGEVQMMSSQGLRDVEYILSPVRDEEERVTAVVLAARDITQRNKTKAVLHYAQKMESLGILAGGVAHDFNNLLVGMMAQTSLAIAKLPADSPAIRHLQKAMEATERAAVLTQQMLAYSGHGQFTAVPLHLNTLIQDYLHLLRVSVSSHISIELDLAANLPMMEGDPGQLQQLLLNLVLNSNEAIGNRDGIIRLATAVRPVSITDDVYWQLTNFPLSPGNYLVLTVEDNGEGIDAATLPRLFEPFFTTRFTGRGLGLAAVLGIIRGHRGGVRVVSKPGAGANFEMLFPALPEIVNITHSRTPARTNSGRVLVIDDEPAVCETITDILELEQIETVIAFDGETAIATYQQHRDQIDLVLLDLSLPGLRGEEIFNQLKACNADVRVILTSGYNEVEAIRGFGEEPVAFLQKPYSLDELVTAVRQHLPPASANYHS